MVWLGFSVLLILAGLGALVGTFIMRETIFATTWAVVSVALFALAGVLGIWRIAMLLDDFIEEYRNRR